MTPTTTLPRDRRRKAMGAYYTPRELIELLLDHSLPPPAGAELRVLDPACGPGDFLLAARARGVPADCLYGIDIDPDAVERCRTNVGTSDPARIRAADALLDPPEFLRPGSFDLVLGNPPYVNGIEGHLSPGLKARLRARYPAVRGAADLAHFFLDQASQLVRPGGRIAFVLPRAVLNSPAARGFRADLPPHLRPNLIYAPERHDFFPGAAVFICLLVLGPEPICQVSTDPEPATAVFRSVRIDGHNWWLALNLGMSGAHANDVSGRPVSEVFEVSASMTAADAYDLLPHLYDSRDGPGLKLVTTGLIEPGECVWGQRTCRYLRRDYQYPRVRVSDALTRSLAGRAARSRRPKILVAGLARRIEAFLDPDGQSIGAVSTYSIYHPQDDLPALERLLKQLLAPPTTQQLIRHLGGNGLRGQHITLKREFLRKLPLVDLQTMG
ncbi:MAG TPA: N-6 DNA methylase [Tepidisphaeraceae bacterium]|jgi:SAM-dependent methyltransferase